MNKLFLIDAYALIYRFYYAFIGRPMRNNEGINTSAVFGFTRFLNDIVRRERPHYMGVAFDPKGGSFRTDLYTEYKANREATPEDIITAVPYIKRILEAMRIPILEIPGYEADDVIGTLSDKGACKDGFEIYMVTPDKDYGQLVQDCVYIYKQRKGSDGIEIIGKEQIKEKYGVDDPRLIIDVLALWGDASDNIPGVPGVGEKTAVKLVNQYGTVENILAHVEEIKGKLGENLAANREQLALSKELATICLDVPIDFEPDKLLLKEPDYEALADIYRELGFHSMLRELGRSGELEAGDLSDKESSKMARALKTAKERNESSAPDLFSGVSAESSLARSLAQKQEALQGDLFGGGNPAPMPAASDGLLTIETVPHDYRLLTGESEIAELSAQLAALPEFCFDTETNGFDVFNDRLVGLSFSFREGEAYYVHFPETREAVLPLLEYFRPAFENPEISKVAMNAKFDVMVLRNYGIEVEGFLYDPMLIHYLLDPETRHGMDFLAQRFLNYSPIPIESLIGKGAKQICMGMVASERCAEYSAEDADITLRLKNVLWPKLQEAGLESLYRTIEEPLIRVLASMEMEGVRIDSAGLKAYGEQLSVELAEIERTIREMVEDPGLNVNSAKQLGDALFGRMKIDPNAKKTKTKQFRTDEEYLQSMSDKHPVIGLILEYRGLKKLLTTYIDALPLLVNKTTGKIHTSFNQAVTATGRLSSNNPNLQNIPIRDEQGRMIRKSFIPSEDGCLLMSADYSQVELRIMAHLSKDEAMIAAFDQDKDIHTATAARIFGVPENEVTPEQRRRAKTANFGIIYGISAFGLSQRLGIPRSEAKEIIDGYFLNFPGVRRFIDDSVSKAREEGYVSTIFGRKRFLPDIRSSNAVVRGLAERNAINAPIQGSAADIIKLAMTEVHRTLRDSGLRSRVILQVHDELVLNVYPEELDRVKEIVVHSMEGAARLCVKLVAECGYGNNWLEAH